MNGATSLHACVGGAVASFTTESMNVIETMRAVEKDQLLDLTHSDLKSMIQSGKAFLIQIQAEWCGECFLMQSILKKIQHEFNDIAIGTIDIDTNESVAKHYGVTELPFILCFNHGQLVDHVIGLQSKKALVKLAEKTIQFTTHDS